jgi:hypothetical protein
MFIEGGGCAKKGAIKVLRDFEKKSISWAIGAIKERKAEVVSGLAQYGAIALRGIQWRSAEDAALLTGLISPLSGAYVGGATPRSKISKNIYESTRVPSNLELGLHQEMAYLPRFPNALIFSCIQPALTGGETTFLNMHDFLRAVSLEKIEEIRTRGLQYHRNLAARPNAISFMHRPWPEVFDVDSKEAAENACDAIGLQYAWRDDGSLDVVHNASGFVEHPLLLRQVWFNQLLAQHANARVIGALYAMLLKRKTSKAMPHTVTFGDGSEIPFEFLSELYDIQEKNMLTHRWEAGDIVLIDNLTCAHGRKPYAGDRKMLVSMGNWYEQ